MSKIPKQIYMLKNNIVFIVALSVWVILFATIYTPTFGRLPQGADFTQTQECVSLWYQHSSFCIPILSAILFVVMSISRLMLWGVTRINRISEFEYFVWQVSEIIVACLFFDLFLSLYFDKSYFGLFPSILLISLLVLALPCTIFWLYSEKKEKELRLQEASQMIVDLRNGIDRAAAEPATMKFVDEKGNVKLIVSAKLVYTIEAAGNYVTILYENNGRITRFALRNTLKAIEDMCSVQGLVRCHRSWFVNIRKVKLLRHDPDGIYAEIDAEGVPDIPVSKNYSASLIQRLSID